MKINEMFESIQGEGPLTGVRSIFVRTHGCNLACPWCDTKYAWDGRNYMEMTIGQIVDYVMRAPGISHVVITGGEPTIQMGELVELSRILREQGWHVTLETNGVIMADPKDFDLVMVSPKDLTTADDWLESVLQSKNVEYKFVVNLDNIQSILDWIAEMKLSGVYLMPQGTLVDDLIDGSLQIMVETAKRQLDCIICPRVHLWLGVR